MCTEHLDCVRRHFFGVTFAPRNLVPTPRLGTTSSQGQKYVRLSYRTITQSSTIPDCKTVVYNTAQGVILEIPSILDGDSLIPGELYYLTKDKTDYAWYTTSIKIEDDDLPDQKGQQTILRVASLGHALIVYVNGEYAGNAHGSHEMKSFVFAKPVNLRTGDNHISILGYTNRITRQWIIHGTQAGLEGEKKEVYTEEGSKKVKWEKDGERKPLTWYKTYFETPEGENAVTIRMKGMGKGLIWVNGIGVGRYWMSFLSPLGEPTQTEYHIPRSFMKEEKKKNMLVILEEEPGVKSEAIDFVLVNRDTI